ncbi:MAG: BatD family protein [Bdellovibrio bacteriovorus]
MLLILTLISAAAPAAGLLADPDRTRLGEGEILTLRLIAEGRLQGEPDLSPLEQDFEILGRSTSTRTTIVNGDMSQSREWVLELAPRRLGELRIPSLVLGGERSDPVTIQVVPADQMRQAGQPKPLYLQTRVDTPSPYVQEPFGYRVRIYYLDPPQRATLSEPRVDGAIIEQRGDDQSTTEVVDGRRYTVIERRYLVVPQRSGAITISGPRLDAVVTDNRPGARRSPFADLDAMLGGRVFQGMPGLADPGGGRRVVERGPDLTLEIRPQPAGSTIPWLPAQSIQLADQWTPSPPRLRVGEPLTRTLTITGQGVTAAQLPTLDVGSPDGVKVYPEPPTAEDLAGGGPPAAVKTLKLALVPTRVGPLTLPEIRLHWWDTVEDRQRVAVIPERTLEVEPAADAATTEPFPAASQPQSSGNPAAEPEPDRRSPSTGAAAPQVPGESGAGPGLWPWLSLMLGLGWLLTLAWTLWRRGRGGAAMPRQTAPDAGARAESARSALAKLHRACGQGDPRAAREALLGWGRARWPQRPPRGLGPLAERLGEVDAIQVLGDLDRAIYAQDNAGGVPGWDGMAAWARLEPLLRAEQVTASPRGAGPLPPLYPQRS